MTKNNTQKIVWLFLTFIAFLNGIMTLTVYKQSVLSTFAGVMQIVGGVFILIIVYIVFKKKV
ncbi:hypothetical protein [Aquibacillus kalidii]|uniref:hypothetical protein n=1 Tax=Aquibacillus kalidii TaxID=2762597 RepID=UPI0016456F32|nr:hypothetical protein [Aquibacillus kalidii]